MGDSLNKIMMAQIQLMIYLMTLYNILIWAWVLLIMRQKLNIN